MKARTLGWNVRDVDTASGRSVPKGEVILWDLSSGQKFRSHQDNPKNSHLGTFSPDGRGYVTCGGEAYEGNDKKAILWDLETGRKLRSFEELNSVLSVSFSPTSRQLCTSSYRLIPAASQPNGPLPFIPAATVWDVTSGQKLRTLAGHSENIASAAFSPDGRCILTASYDKAAILWDVSNGGKLRLLHVNGAQAVLSPDGRFVLNGAGGLWDLATGDELARLISVDQGQDWLVVTPEGLFDGSEGGRNKVSFRVGAGLNVVPVDRFFKDFYRPGLLADLTRGLRPVPEVELGGALPPMVRFVSPQQGGTVEGMPEPWQHFFGSAVLNSIGRFIRRS
jgi:WD40 repeat protein